MKESVPMRAPSRVKTRVNEPGGRPRSEKEPSTPTVVLVPGLSETATTMEPGFAGRAEVDEAPTIDEAAEACPAATTDPLSETVPSDEGPAGLELPPQALSVHMSRARARVETLRVRNDLGLDVMGTSG